MFKKTRFNKGDRVQILENLSENHRVENAYFEGETERVALSNYQVYNADSLTFYSAPIRRLADKNVSLEKQIVALQKQNEESQKELEEFKKEVKGEPITASWVGYFVRWAGVYSQGDTKEEKPKTKSLLERIEELEKALAQKEKAKKVVKEKSKKKK